MYDVTVFYSKGKKSKFPISPYDDDTFIFETVQVETKDELFRVAVHNYILNIPKNLKEPIRTYRRKSSFNAYKKDYYNYIVIDCDDIYTEENRQNVLNFFKKYNCIIGESRCADGKENFNLKGFVFTEDIAYQDLKFAVADLHDKLKDYCDLDECVARDVSLNCPINKYEILLDSDGELYRYDMQKYHKIHTENSIKVYNLEKLNSDEFQDIEADSIDQLCLKIFQKMGFQAMSVENNGVIRFKHPTEKKSIGGYYWFSTSPYTMHHFNISKTVNIYEQVKNLKNAKGLLANSINYDDALKHFNVNTKIIQVNEKFLRVTDDIKKAVTDFLENSFGLFSIRSPMGTGKSTIIGHIIQESQENDLRVLIITNRISVAEDFSKKYSLKVYNSGTYNLGDSLICQFDSLWKYNLKYFDIVIMDEFISLMIHSRTAINSTALNISKFLSAFDKKLVIADAFLTGYENFLLTDKVSNLYLIDNTYRDPTTMYLYNDKNYFLLQMLKVARKNQITVSVTSLNFAKSLRKLFVKNGLKVIMLTAQTSENEKKLIYKLFEKTDNNKWDVLIYSPTLTVGISNLNSTFYHFHYDSSMTTEVISSIQMIKRTRKAKEIHLYIKPKLNFVKTTFDDLRDEYLYNVGKASETNYMFEINAYGEPRLSKIGEKCIKIDCFRNILEYNHLSGFLFMSKYHFLNAPTVIENQFQENILTLYHKEVMNDKKMNNSDIIEQYIDLKDDYEGLRELGLLELSDIDAQLYSSQDKPDFTIELRKELLLNYMNDKNFIRKCKFYKILRDYMSGAITKDDIRVMISYIIMHNKKDAESIDILSEIIRVEEKGLQNSYSISFVNNHLRLKKLLIFCGYMIYNNNVERIGERYFEISREVLKFCEYVK